ncbi:MAG: hypothetical protein N4A57_07965 [Anaeromicrobium sp.]|jgi:hypothetical protein|uniref:hypothetical protein n=1 Tax=Anaeromicrobium sp. TaxID=1929132 RepID=UPI0025D417D6|nr:hypothetical protein [Anaeromicrobium sp.]MCT4594186.1 hypothetical protein [Anaeromicrobium sp.]
MDKYVIEERDNIYVLHNLVKSTQKTIKKYMFFNRYKEFGFKSKDDFIFNYIQKNITTEQREKIDELMKQENKLIGYKRKKSNEKKMKIREEIKEKHGNLLYKEREKLVKRASKNPSGRAIRMRLLKDLKDDEIKALKRKLKLKKKDIKDIIKKIEIDEDEFETIQEVYKYFGGMVDPMDYIEGLKINWMDCSIIKGNTALISIYNDKYKILSSNLKKEECLAFDLIDLFGLYNIDIFQIIEMKELKVKGYEQIKAGQKKLEDERKRYKKMIKEIQSKKIGNKYPKLSKYLKNIIDVYIKLLEKGIENINHTGQFLGDKGIYFVSIRDLVKLFNDEGIKIEKSSVCNKINLLCCLGLIEKVFAWSLPVALIPDDKKVYKAKDWYDNNYFILPKVDFKEVEKIALILKENNITLRNFNKKTVEEVFGQDMVDRIFQKTKKENDKEFETKIEEFKNGNKEIEKVDTIESDMETDGFSTISADEVECDLFDF